MKHYRFKNARAINWIKKIRRLVILMFVIYSLYWVFIAYHLKQQLLQLIADTNSTGNNIQIRFNEIDVTGYPLKHEIELTGAVLSLDMAEGAKFSASWVESLEDPFPKLAYRQEYMAIDGPLKIRHNTLRNEYRFELPSNIVLRHYFNKQDPIDTAYKFEDNPKIKIGLHMADKISEVLPKEIKWLSEVKFLSLHLPSNEVRELNGEKLISSSKGLDLFFKREMTRDNFIKYNIIYDDIGSRYTESFGNLLNPLMQTLYFKHLGNVMPIYYENINYLRKYIESGDNKLSLNLNTELDLANLNLGEIKVETNLSEFRQEDDYGVLNGKLNIKALINKKNNSVKLNNSGYFALSVNQSWYERWLNNIDFAMRNVSYAAPVSHYKDKLMLFFPKLHKYKYAALSYSYNYENNVRSKKAELMNQYSLDHLRFQTNEFSFSIDKGDDFDSDLSKLPLNYNIKIREYQSVVYMFSNYLSLLLDDEHVNSHRNKISATNNEQVIDFINKLQYKYGLCKRDWNGRLKLVKGDWYLGDYLLSSIKSIILNLMVES
jgi:hypothetical protein